MSENEQKPQTEEQPKAEENATPAESTEPATNAVEENGVKEDGDAGKGEEEKKEEGGAEGKTENAADAKTEAKEEVNLEAPKENPFSEDDLEQILQLEASEGEDNGWQKGKNQKGVTVLKKSEKPNGVPIIKAYMEFPGIPLDKVLELLTNVEERRKWNKKTPTYEVLEERDDFKIIYQMIKMPTACDDRDMVQSTIVRSDQDQKRHVILYKACNHPNKPPNKGAIRADVPLMGIIIRTKEEEENSTKLTWISQISLKGWVPKMIVNRVTSHYPVSLCDDLTQYWKKLTAPKEEPKKDKKADAKEDGEEKKEEGGEEGKKEEKKEGEEAAKEEEKKDEEEKPKENGEPAPEEEKKEEEVGDKEEKEEAK